MDDDFEVVEVRRVDALQPTRVPPPPVGPPRHRRRFGAVAAAVALMAGGVAVWVWSTTQVADRAIDGWRGTLPVPAVPQQPLTGLVVYISAGHGWLLHREHHDGDPRSWGPQRPEVHGVLEDRWTAHFVADELAPALEAAGATVIALRERDRNALKVVVDDGDRGYAATELLERRSLGLAHGDDDELLAASGGALWWLEVPHDGHWYLYTRWTADDDHDAQAVYTVAGGGHVAEVVVDQRHHGGHWYPLVDLCLFGGDTVQVTLTGSGQGLLSADAVRMGGGTTPVLLPHVHDVQLRPAWELAMAHQLDQLGGPPELAEYACGAPVSDMRLRGHWTSWARADGEDAVFLSIHTNATHRGLAEGLMVFAGIDGRPRTPPLPASVDIAESLERAIVQSVRERDPEFPSHGVKLGDFSEVSPLHNQVPGALLELGFHDNPKDARRLNDPAFRAAAARGIVEGLRAWRDPGS